MANQQTMLTDCPHCGLTQRADRNEDGSPDLITEQCHVCGKHLCDACAQFICDTCGVCCEEHRHGKTEFCMADFAKLDAAEHIFEAGYGLSHAHGTMDNTIAAAEAHLAAAKDLLTKGGKA